MANKLAHEHCHIRIRRAALCRLRDVLQRGAFPWNGRPARGFSSSLGGEGAEGEAAGWGVAISTALPGTRRELLPDLCRASAALPRVWLSATRGSFQRRNSGIRCDGKNPRGAQAQRPCAGVAGNARRPPKNQTAGHTVRGSFHPATRPNSSRRVSARGVAGRNDRVGRNAGQEFSHLASGVESRGCILIGFVEPYFTAVA